MKPTVGRDVHLRSSAGVQAAKITYVWSDGDPAAGDQVAVNLTVFVDGGDIAYAGSIRLFETAQEAERAWIDGAGPVAYWPPRA